MTKNVSDFLEELDNNSELKDELKNLLQIYPEKDVLYSFSFDEQIKFIYEVIIPFARKHGFEFCVEDILTDSDLSSVDEQFLAEVVGGADLGTKLSASTLAAVQALTLVQPVEAGGVLDRDSLQISTSYIEKSEGKEADFDAVVDTLEKNYATLHPISEEYPINEVDGMIFATLAYLPMNCVPNLDSDMTGEEITIYRWYECFLKYFNESDQNLNLHDEDEHNVMKYSPQRLLARSNDVMRNRRVKLFDILSKSPRYMNIKIGNFKGKYSDTAHEDYEQFAAVTFTLENGTKVVSFRGTDSTLSGWREDLDLSWSKQVPAQKDALKYLEDIYNLNPNSDFVVTGHSKGGNLAVYSSFYMCAGDDKFLDRLKNIFNYDGPGLSKEIISDIDPNLFDRISEKLATFVPQSSIIGRIMNDRSKGKFICVYSSSPSVIDQHDSLSWHIYKDYEKSDVKFKSYEIQPESEFSADMFSAFLDSIDKENSLKIFVNWVFDFMHRNNINVGRRNNPKQIFKQVVYNYFIKGKSLEEIIDTVFSPGRAIGISAQEQESFKQVMKSVFIALTTAYKNKYSQINKKMGLSDEFNDTVERVVTTGYSFGDVSNLVKLMVLKIFDFENIGKFIKKLYS